VAILIFEAEYACLKEHGHHAVERLLKRQQTGLSNPDRLSAWVCCTDVPNFPWRAEGDRRQAISARSFIVPFKHHSKGRRHIPRQRHRVTNWRDYDTALRNRGSLTIWFTEEALVGWRAQSRKTPGGQPHYSNLAIETALTLRAVFRLALRQSEGLIGSIMELLEIDLPVPDHSTLSRRACGVPVQNLPRSGTGKLHLIVDSTGLKLRGAGEWLFEKHGTSKRRSWRKLHVGIDADNGQIVAFDLTDKEIDDASHVEPLLEQLDDAPASFMGDGAYDRAHVSTPFASEILTSDSSFLHAREPCWDQPQRPLRPSGIRTFVQSINMGA
jgi:hypothetical protein